MNKCLCGCGLVVKNKYANGHWVRCHQPMKNEETEKKSSITHKKICCGINNPFYGKHHTMGTIKKISIAKTGIVRPEEEKLKISKTMKSKYQKETHHMKGKKLSPEWKNNISKSITGDKNGFFGKHHSKKARYSMSVSHKLLVGPLAPQWMGGKSFETYGKEFNTKLKEKIKLRDKYSCMHPDCPYCINWLDIHHIDYNKKNNKESNLISLCRRHHTRTNNKLLRMFYTDFYTEILMKSQEVHFDTL